MSIHAQNDAGRRYTTQEKKQICTRLSYYDPVEIVLQHALCMQPFMLSMLIATDSCARCVLHLAGLDGMRLIQDHDLGSQLLQLVLQLGHKVVAGDEELELLAFQLAIFALCDHVDTVICDAKPLVQCICPLLCTAQIQDDRCACCAYLGASEG